MQIKAKLDNKTWRAFKFSTGVVSEGGDHYVKVYRTLLAGVSGRSEGLAIGGRNMKRSEGGGYLKGRREKDGGDGLKGARDGAMRG